jgi:glutathione S-transferase
MLAWMKLFQVATCPFAHRARIVLEEKKLPYEVSYYDRQARPAALAAVSPDARSPTLFDDDGRTVVWDSLIVPEYLDERYPETPLMPEDAAGRARARLMMREVDVRFGPGMAPIMEQVVHRREGQPRDESKVQAGVALFQDALADWQSRLGDRPFLLGDQFTLADIVLFTPVVALVRVLGPSGDVPGNLTSLRAWRDRIAARPSTAY